MRLLIVRHAEPDYSIDSLTEKGVREAECLSERLPKLNIDYAYVSPLGRAKKTAEIGLSKTNLIPTQCEWLREFHGRCYHREIDREHICWDLMPADFAADKTLFDPFGWTESELVKNTNVPSEYKFVSDGIDELLARHGYVRDGLMYKAVKPSRDTVVLFCHFGVESVILSHILNISPFALWHGTVALPSSVTSVYTEEREKGIAYFRMNYFADISHLYAKDEKPSFMARYCETFDSDETH